MNIQPIAFFRSPLTSKFGIPRQSGLATSLPGRIEFEPAFRHEEAIRGLDGFSHLWIIWEFSANKHEAVGLTVRPPRLGGNERLGVFATRSPFRPNGLGLSCVRLKGIEMTMQKGPVIHVEGADLMDGTPIYDLKPYVAYTDAHPDARCGFVDEREWRPVEVEMPQQLLSKFTVDELKGLVQVLSQDPRPRYHDAPDRIYGMPFAGRDVRFRVEGQRLFVVEVL